MECHSIRIEVAVCKVNEFVGVSKGEVPILEDVLPCCSLILCDTPVIDASGEFGRDVFLVLLQLISMVRIGPEDGIGEPLKSSDPITLGADLSPLPCGTTADCEFLPLPKLDRVVILGLDRLEVFNDGLEVNVAVAKDVTPVGVREWWAVSLSIETADGILGIKVVHRLEHLGFSYGAEICPAPPGRSSPSCAPIPSIVRVMDIIIVPCPL